MCSRRFPSAWRPGRRIDPVRRVRCSGCTARLTLMPFAVEGSEPRAFAGGWAGPETVVSFGANVSFPRVPAGRHGLIRIVKTDGGGAHVEIASVTVLPGQIAPVHLTGQGARIRIQLVVPPDVDEREVLRSARLTAVHPFPIRPDMTEAEYRAGVSDPANSVAMNLETWDSRSARRSLALPRVAPGFLDLETSILNLESALPRGARSSVG